MLRRSWKYVRHPSFSIVVCASALLILTSCGDGQDDPEDDEGASKLTLRMAADCGAGDCGSFVGSLKRTFYILATQNDYPEDSYPSDTSAPGRDGSSLGNFSGEFLADVCLQGSGILRDGTPIHVTRSCAGYTASVYSTEIDGKWCNNFCFEFLDRNQYPFGLARNGETPNPLRSVAVWSDQVPLGSIIYIPEFDGFAVPDSGKIHDGCFKANDTGGAITHGRIDIHAGTGRRETSLYKRTTGSFGGTVDVYMNSPRCANATLEAFFPLNVALGLGDGPATVLPDVQIPDVELPDLPEMPEFSPAPAATGCHARFTPPGGTEQEATWACETDLSFSECSSQAFLCQRPGQGGGRWDLGGIRDACNTNPQLEGQGDWLGIPVCSGVTSTQPAEQITGYAWSDTWNTHPYCVAQPSGNAVHPDRCRETVGTQFLWVKHLVGGYFCEEHTLEGVKIGEVDARVCDIQFQSSYAWEPRLGIGLLGWVCAKYDNTGTRLDEVDVSVCETNLGKTYQWTANFWWQECHAYTPDGRDMGKTDEALCGAKT